MVDFGAAELRDEAFAAGTDKTIHAIGPDGKGQGKLAGAAKITWNRETRTIEIENFGIEPVRLQNVQVVGK